MEVDELKSIADIRAYIEWFFDDIEVKAKASKGLTMLRYRIGIVLLKRLNKLFCFISKKI
jgi:hypothetical protein